MKTSTGLPGRLEAIAFLSGAIVMVFEITGSRVLAPFLGTSVFVWTTLIGVIMASLSFGYWWGGRMADREPRYSRLSAILFAASAFVTITAISQDILLRLLQVAGLEIRIAALLATLVLFAPASTMLGMVTPYVVRLKLTSIDHSGAEVGRLYAISTAGSIVGTFACGYFLLSWLGSSRILFVIAFLLMGLSFLAALQNRLVTRIAVGVFLLLAGSLAEYQSNASAAAGYRDFDTNYQRIQVFDGKSRIDGRMVRVLKAEGANAQSSIYLDGPGLVSEYLQVFELTRRTGRPMRKVLMIGSAACVYPMHLLREMPDVSVDVVEIDPEMTEVARKYFRLRDSPRLRIFHEDGRTFVNRALQRGLADYDAVFIDAFQTRVPPFQLLTAEFVKSVEQMVSPDGVVALNLIARLEPRHDGLGAAIITTFRSVFPELSLFAVYPEDDPGELQNLVLFAARTPLQFDRGSVKISRPEARPKQIDATKYQGMMLTDDFAPVEQLVMIR